MPQAPNQAQHPITLVPNQVSLDLRLAAYFRAQAGDARSVPAPPLEILSRWAASLSKRAALLRGEAAPLAPGPLAIQRLWEKTIEPDTPDWLPAERWTLAAQAMDADRLLLQWTQAGQEWGGGLAWRRFMRWRERVHAALEANGWQTPERQLVRLVGQIREGRVRAGLLPRHIRLEGFVETTRLERDLLDALSGAGVETELCRPSTTGAIRAELRPCESLDEELLAAARWARERLAAGARNVAVLVNGLDAIRERVSWAFENTFQGPELLGLADPADSEFHLRFAATLASHPVVDSALRLIEFSCGRHGKTRSFHPISRWLLSSAWAGSDSERFARATLEHRLRQKGRYHWSPAGVSAMAGGLEVPQLLERVTRWPAPVEGAHPADSFRGYLAHWGWPGPLALDPRGQQAVRRFLRQLEKLSLLDELPVSGAVRFLRQMCANERLPAGGGTLSPVQVVSPDDAFGVDFEAACLVNVHAGNWPGPARQNPLLPGAVNREIPRASSPGQLEYTRRLNQAILECAPDVICSWGRQARAGVPRAQSSLLPTGEPAESNSTKALTLAASAYPDVAALNGFARHPWLEEVHFHTGAPLEPGADRLTRAVDILAMQSACPFAAYLIHRLQAVFEPVPSLFADRAFAGWLLHTALERLYQAHAGAGTVPRDQEVPPAVEAALEHCNADRRLPPVTLAAERQRLASLLREWLEAENRRGTRPVDRLEQELEGELAGFRFDVRIDRVDRLPDGRAFALDYKSGAMPALAWHTARLTQPQLPLYALLLAQGGGPAGGLALASVRSGDIRLKGLVDDQRLAGAGIEGFEKPGKLAGGLGSWEAALGHWRGAFETVLDEFRAGHCEHVVYHEAPLRYLGLSLLLQHERLRDWNAARAGGADASPAA